MSESKFLRKYNHVEQNKDNNIAIWRAYNDLKKEYTGYGERIKILSIAFGLPKDKIELTLLDIEKQLYPERVD